MSFSDPFESIIITPLEDDTVDLLDEVPQESDTGWDSMMQTYLVRDVSAGISTTAALTGRFARGSALPGLNMYIQARTCRCVARGLFKVEVSSKGILSSRGFKVSYDSVAQNQQAENLMVDGVFRSKLSTHESSCTALIEYIQIGGSPPTAKTGTASAPIGGWAPAVRGTIWATAPVYHYPNGWICERVAAENLPGLSVWLIREGYKYIYPISP